MAGNSFKKLDRERSFTLFFAHVVEFLTVSVTSLAILGQKSVDAASESFAKSPDVPLTLGNVPRVAGVVEAQTAPQSALLGPGERS
jgi:hypothetical protein